MKTFLFLSLSILLMMATRGHYNWQISLVHLPDFTLPALLIAGIYFRQFWVAFVLIISAVAIDNYAIIHQGVSANCITPAYSFLPLTYYAVFWAGKYINSLQINKNSFRNITTITVVISFQWFFATLSYYAFTASTWAKFFTYALHWSTIEILPTLYWVGVVMIMFTLGLKLSFKSISKANA
jgi:hypothetical protein